MRTRQVVSGGFRVSSQLEVVIVKSIDSLCVCWQPTKMLEWNFKCSGKLDRIFFRSPKMSRRKINGNYECLGAFFYEILCGMMRCHFIRNSKIKYVNFWTMLHSLCTIKNLFNLPLFQGKSARLISILSLWMIIIIFPCQFTLNRFTKRVEFVLYFCGIARRRSQAVFFSAFSLVKRIMYTPFKTEHALNEGIKSIKWNGRMLKYK